MSPSWQRYCNKLLPAGEVQVLDQNIVVEAGDFIHSAGELRKLVINVIEGVPIYLDDVARVIDGPCRTRPSITGTFDRLSKFLRKWLDGRRLRSYWISAAI